MRKALGDHRPRTLGKASFFGVISSSCSYASSALAKTLFARGADFTAAMVFMIASTNLVVELGIVLWLLIGWQFALAEFVGGAIMIVLLGLVDPARDPARAGSPMPATASTPTEAAASGPARTPTSDHGHGPTMAARDRTSVSRCGSGCAAAPAGATRPATRSAT